MTEIEKKKAHIEAQAKFRKEKTVCFQMQLNKNTDADIIELLSTKQSKQGYIKALIRADMTKVKE